jgi:hypothetical protein
MILPIRRFAFKSFFAAILIAIPALQSCQKVTFFLDKTEKIEGQYTNRAQPPFGVMPSFKVNSSSNWIEYDESGISAVNKGNGTVRITIDGVRSKYRVPKEIDKITIQEKKGEKWEKEDEFQNNATSTKTSISAVLVLDISSSIGDNIGDLKNYAKEFITEIFNANENSEIALVLFSKDIISSPFYKKNNRQMLDNFIDNATNYQDRTTLYEACLKGLDLLQTSATNKIKTEIIFTDGGDNNSDNPETALENIKASKITRYAIGVDGKDFSKPTIKEICTGDNWVKARNYDNLKKVFTEISSLIANVYKIEYDRSDQQLESAIDIRFKIKFKN